ncbi:hypothetical protein ACHAWF_013681 [Thalassiosira exigua]
MAVRSPSPPPGGGGFGSGSGSGPGGSDGGGGGGGSSGRSPRPNRHHYAIDAARLVDRCRRHLRAILEGMEGAARSDRAFRRRSFQLMGLADALKCVDRLVHAHLLDLLDREMEFLSSIRERHRFFGEHTEFPTLVDTARTLRCVEGVANEHRGGGDRIAAVGFDGTTSAGGNNPQRSPQRSPHLSIDDPVEDEGGEGWYFGAGRRSSSPPPPSPLQIQSAGDVSPPPIPPRVAGRWGAGAPSSPPFLGGRLGSPKKHSRSDRYAPSRSERDSSLFRLIVTLQLCLVRIEEADAVLCKGRAGAAMRREDRRRPRRSSFDSGDCLNNHSGQSRPRRSSFDWEEHNNNGNNSNSGIPMSISEESEVSRSSHPSELPADRCWKTRHLLAIAGVAVVGGAAFVTGSGSAETKSAQSERIKLLQTSGKVVAGAMAASFVRKRWRILCTNARVADSADAVEDWIFHWICLGSPDGGRAGYGRIVAPRKSVLWYSNGSIRFQLMKRGMDLLYASIGKAIEITRGPEAAAEAMVSHDPKSLSSSSSSGLWTYVVASLAASYYNVVGPAAKSASSLASAPSSVIRNAWGMVSLPAVKKASLEATRILKGAAIADRIEICGVSCFVLSREPFPALASALRRYRRQQEREDVRLGTIHERSGLSSHPSSANVRGFQKRNLILHLTGGGFFAHTIAGDLPYLLDWSASSKAVVIIPEYALFPHRYPDAISQITQLYRALRCGQAAALLGFQPDRIVVSGESVGGNLAAALCVSMISDYEEGQCVEMSPRRSAEMVEDVLDIYGEGEDPTAPSIPAGELHSESHYMGLELPDALMLCCPALNLSLDTTPSRIDGANDPVLPSALITTISKSYLGECLETDPVASPSFASDDILRSFPPTLIFTSTNDPLLDDSIAFNGRLRKVGVKSSLRAAHDLPHAFWALSTAGIPEARHVQNECQQWLSKKFA